MARLDVRLTLETAFAHRESRVVARLLLEMVNPLRVKLDLLPLTEADLVSLLRRVLATPQEG